MRRSSCRTAVLVAILQISAMVVPLHTACALPAAPERESVDSAAVRALWATLDAAWNARDAEQFSQFFTEDVSFAFVDRGQSFEGRAPIRQHFAEQFPRLAPDLRHVTHVHENRLIAPDVIAVDGEVEILGAGSDGISAPAVLRTFAIFAVIAQADERWRIRVLRIYQLSAETGGADTRIK